MSRIVAELALDARAQVGEGPRWDTATQRLLWVDIHGGTVHRWDPSSGIDEVWKVGSFVGALALTTSEKFVLALPHGPARWSPGSDPIPLVSLHDEGDGRRLNDAAVDPQGRLLFGTMGLGDRGTGDGRLYRYGDAGCSIVRRSIGLPNGIDWSPDGRTLYFADSLTGRVDGIPYDGDDPVLPPATSSLTVPHGLPDGHTVDADGNIWVALWSAGEVVCFSPDGRVIATVVVPVDTVTSCAFGGEGLDTLFITTMLSPTEPDNPLAGGIFACRPGAVGRLPNRMRLDD